VRIVWTLEFDLDINASGEVELHESVHGLRSGLNNIKQAAMRPNFELLAALLVYVR
jgi:hypothetical protein